jgi:5-dehydro-2-deoxygluconokinase
MEKHLFILPFDHRKSFAKDLLNIDGKPTKEQAQKVSELKDIVYQAFLKTREQYQNKNDFGILVDWQYGQKILKDAQKKGVIISTPVEKSGQEGFDFEYGKKFGDYLLKIKPDYVKVLVRYNPENIDLNKAQLEKLKVLSAFCKQNKLKLLFELLVPPTATDLKVAKNQKNYDNNFRFQKTAQAIKEIKKQVKVDVWKLEGFSKDQWQDIIGQTGSTKIIVLGRAGSKAVVTNWLNDAKTYPTIFGFAVGRTIFAKPLADFIANKISKEKAINNISKDFDFFVKVWNTPQ